VVKVVSIAAISSLGGFTPLHTGTLTEEAELEFILKTKRLGFRFLNVNDIIYRHGSNNPCIH